MPPDIDESTKIKGILRFLIGPSVEELSEYSGGVQRGRHKRQPGPPGAITGGGEGVLWRAVVCVSSVLGVGAVFAPARPNSHPAVASRSRSARCPASCLSPSFSSSRAPHTPGPRASPSSTLACTARRVLHLLLLLSRGMTNLDEGASVRPRREAMPPHAAGDPASPPPPLAIRGTPAVCVPTLD